MYTLNDFYSSKEWVTLRKVLMSERVDADGNLICAHCKKPIIRNHDCIAHHKTELTEENVNDAEISLNPANVALIHFSCHNKIHDRWKEARKENAAWQGVYLVYGSPCSGKTSWVNEVANDDDLILDVDRLWDAMCNGGRYNKTVGKSQRPSRLKSNVLGVRNCIIEQIKSRTGFWRRAYIIGGYPLRSERDRLCLLLKATPIFVECTKEECLKRAETERPEEWKGYIENWFDNYIP